MLIVHNHNFYMSEFGKSPMERMHVAKEATEQYVREREAGENLAKVAVAELLVRIAEKLHERVRNSGQGYVGEIPGYLQNIETMLQKLEKVEDAQLSVRTEDGRMLYDMDGMDIVDGRGRVTVHVKNGGTIDLELLTMKNILGEDVWKEITGHM